MQGLKLQLSLWLSQVRASWGWALLLPQTGQSPLLSVGQLDQGQKPQMETY